MILRVLIRMVFLAQCSIRAFDFSIGCLFVYSKKLGGISVCDGEMYHNEYLLCRSLRCIQRAATCIAARTELRGATCLRLQCACEKTNQIVQTDSMKTIMGK